MEIFRLPKGSLYKVISSQQPDENVEWGSLPPDARVESVASALRRRIVQLNFYAEELDSAAEEMKIMKKMKIKVKMNYSINEELLHS